MNNSHDHNQRLQKILFLIALKGKVSSAELCQRFQLTDKEVQQDFKLLEEAHLLKISQGNAYQAKFKE
ncbi:MAG: DeoR family transcriptional regulator [Marinomonas sp.]|jgi:DeoR/GlpR family transcriptional regulator of sugar metabolism